MKTHRAVAIRVGPYPATGSTAVEVLFSDGTNTFLELDVAHANAICLRLRECLDGRICQRAPSRRVLEIHLGPDEAPSSVAGLAVVPDLDVDLAQQGVT